MRDSYRDRTSRPIYALVYLLFFIIFYEIGTFIISPEVLDQSMSQPQLRVVSFIWLQNALDSIGFSHRMVWIAPPLAVILILLGLQIASRTSWKIRTGDFAPMTIECILLAIPLIVLSLSLNRSVNTQSSVACNQVQSQRGAYSCSMAGAEEQAPKAVQLQNGSSQGRTSRPDSLLVNIVTGIGAGIYEELVFRLILICLLMLLFQDICNMPRTTSIVLSVLISAVLFSAHHYKFILNGSLQTGDEFKFATFIFRLLAGIYFAVVFAVRGFGISAGTHAFYDIIAAILNACFFGGSD